MADESGEDRPPHGPMNRSLGGGIVGYVQRMRAEHGATYHGDVWTGCRCREVGCAAPIWLAHIEGLIDSYEAKVQDFAQETLRSGAARAAIRRTVSPILLAARLNEPPLFSSEFFDKGYPPEVRESLVAALADEWDAVLALRLEPGHTGVLAFSQEAESGRRAGR